MIHHPFLQLRWVFYLPYARGMNRGEACHAHRRSECANVRMIGKVPCLKIIHQENKVEPSQITPHIEPTKLPTPTQNRSTISAPRGKTTGIPQSATASERTLSSSFATNASHRHHRIPEAGLCVSPYQIKLF
jgi:hypothetical protein